MEPLFEVPAVAPLRRPVKRLEGLGAISYAPYRPKKPLRCQDCDQVCLEANLAGEHAALSRQARLKRTQGSSVVYLCAEHAQNRQLEERQLREQA